MDGTIDGGRDASRGPGSITIPEGITWDVAIDTTPGARAGARGLRQEPRAVALDFLGKKTTFGELGQADQRLRRRAAEAVRRQARASRVALLLPNTPFYVVAYYARAAGRRTVVNCNPLYTVHELSHIVAQLRRRHHGHARSASSCSRRPRRWSRPATSRRVIVCHFPDALPTVKKVLYIDRQAQGPRATSKPRRIAGKVVRFDDLIARNDKPTPVSDRSAKATSRCSSTPAAPPACPRARC